VPSGGSGRLLILVPASEARVRPADRGSERGNRSPGGQRSEVGLGLSFFERLELSRRRVAPARGCSQPSKNKRCTINCTVSICGLLVCPRDVVLEVATLRPQSCRSASTSKRGCELYRPMKHLPCKIHNLHVRDHSLCCSTCAAAPRCSGRLDQTAVFASRTHRLWPQLLWPCRLAQFILGTSWKYPSDDHAGSAPQR